MDGLVMDNHMTDERVIVDEPPKRKRLSGYDRMKRKVVWLAGNVEELSKDVAALEALVEKLLSHLGATTGPGATEEDRARSRATLTAVLSALNDDQGENDVVLA
jgi:hypothetical protein